MGKSWDLCTKKKKPVRPSTAAVVPAPSELPKNDIPYIADVTMQTITSLSSHVPYMQAETDEGSDWLHGHVSNVRDVTAWGLGNIGTTAAVEVSTDYFFILQQSWPVK